MANKLKKSTKPKTEEKPVKEEKPAKKEKPSSTKLKAEKEEKVDLKKLAKDERTWKIVGTVFLLTSIFLLISFISYFFTWKEDQDKVFNNSSFLFDEDIQVSNLLGRLGAYVSHFFIYRGFGIASLLFCTFFFVVGINLLVRRKVFSIWRNLRYVTIGLLVASVCFAFLFPNADFHYGGEVGKMINSWLVSFLGWIGTGAVLLLVAGSYLIWQINPSFHFPEKKQKEFVSQYSSEDIVPEEAEEVDAITERKNQLKGDGGLIINPTIEEKESNFEIIEKEEEEALTDSEPLVEKEITDDILHKHDDELASVEMEEELVIPPPPPKQKTVGSEIALEIKTVEEKPADEEKQKDYSDLPPYEPTLDLRDYKYPKVDLLETHGSNQ